MSSYQRLKALLAQQLPLRIHSVPSSFPSQRLAYLHHHHVRMCTNNCAPHIADGRPKQDVFEKSFKRTSAARHSKKPERT